MPLLRDSRPRYMRKLDQAANPFAFRSDRVAQFTFRQRAAWWRDGVDRSWRPVYRVLFQPDQVKRSRRDRLELRIRRLWYRVKVMS